MHRHQLVQPVRLSVAARQNEDSLVNPPFANLQHRRQRRRVRAKREADNKEVRVRTVNPAGRAQAERHPRPSMGRDNRSVERKKARGPRYQGRNNFGNCGDDKIRSHCFFSGSYVSCKFC
jgi:hypothetical protein